MGFLDRPTSLRLLDTLELATKQPVPGKDRQLDFLFAFLSLNFHLYFYQSLYLDTTTELLDKPPEVLPQRRGSLAVPLSISSVSTDDYGHLR